MRPPRARARTIRKAISYQSVISEFQAQVEEERTAINVAQDLVALRESRGLPQAQLAERLGITQSAIAQLESAQPKNLELMGLVRVAVALGAHVDVSIYPRRRARRKGRQRATVAGLPSYWYEEAGPPHWAFHEDDVLANCWKKSARRYVLNSLRNGGFIEGW